MALHLDGILNTTFDYPDFPDYDYEDNETTRSVLTVLIPVVCSVVLILGLFGNTLLLAALALRMSSWSVSDIFILHLAVADLLLLLTLPIRAAEASWSSESFGIFCKFCGAVFHINFYCGVFGLLCISLDHYLCTNHTDKWRPLRKPSLAVICCLLVWISSVLLSIPDWMFRTAKKDQEQNLQCDYSYSLTKTNSMLMSRLFHHTVGFSLPVVSLMLLISYFLPSLLCKDLGHQRSRRRSVIVILSLVLGFLLFWLPYNITLICDTALRRSSQTSKTPYGNPKDSMLLALVITSMFGYIHTCLRPLIYLLCCKTFKKQVQKLLMFSNDKIKESLWELSMEERPQTPQEMKLMTGAQSQVQSH